MTDGLYVFQLNLEGVAGNGDVLFFAGEAMSKPDAEIRFAEDVVDAIQAARLRGVDDETLIRLLREIAAELREGGPRQAG
jgi:hypothetical protein